MIKVTCQLQDYSDPAMPSIKVHSHWPSRQQVELEVDGKRYTVDGRDLITAVENAMHTNSAW